MSGLPLAAGAARTPARPRRDPSLARAASAPDRAGRV